MARIGEIIAHLDDRLDARGFADYGPNGLQVPGPDEIGSVVTGVSASAELFEQAAAHGADLVLVHHGLFWQGAPLALDRVAARRLKLLFTHDLALAAYHLPLDAHLETGNNALIAKALGCTSWTGFGDHRGRTIGVAGRFDADGIGRDEFIARVRAVCHDREPLAFPAGPDRVRSVGIVSGAGADHVTEAVAAGLDAFITGEPAERVMTYAREHGITFIAAGHYATETHGVRALGEDLAETFGIDHAFIEIWNPI